MLGTWYLSAGTDRQTRRKRVFTGACCFPGLCIVYRVCKASKENLEQVFVRFLTVAGPIWAQIRREDSRRPARIWSQICPEDGSLRKTANYI